MQKNIMPCFVSTSLAVSISANRNHAMDRYFKTFLIII